MKMVEMDCPTICPRCHRELQAGEMMAVYGTGRWAEILRRCSVCDKDVRRMGGRDREIKEKALFTDPPEQAEALSGLSFGDSMAKIAEKMPSFRK